MSEQNTGNQETNLAGEVGLQQPQVQAPPVVDPVAPNAEPTVEAPTGLFNETLPQELQGNAHIEGMVQIAKAQFPNLDLNRVIGRAWETGDSNLLDLNYLREVTGSFSDHYARYFQDVVDGYYGGIADQQDQIAQEAYDSVGGKEQWGRVVDYFNKTADDSQLSFVKSLLDSKNVAQNKQGLEYIKQMAKLGGLLPSQGKPVSNGGVNPPSASTHGLSAKDFQAEVNKLVRENKYTEENLAPLRERRLLGAQQGL